MKRTILSLVTLVVVLVALSGCSGINALLKSEQPEKIYTKALEYYGKAKWSRASTLFEGVEHYYRNTTREDSIKFYNAHCKYKGQDYEMASMLFDDFRKSYGRSPFLEDAEGMYAMCHYYMSPDAKRDQTMTSRALIAINEFISRYPESDRIEQFKQINEELTERLHEKTYLNAYTYYKIGRYKSAIVALKNALRTYPNSKYREQIMFLIVDSAYELADNSVASKQTDRYLSMMDSYLSFCEEFPESKYRKEVDRMAKHARDYLDQHVKEEVK
ncbi:MAG: outer membrane protein assembly factor BamD [Alistipes sp.]|nr:outer membrane protein assembly factor BamD [Alistipes sp.]